jgi:hypothetical protein
MEPDEAAEALRGLDPDVRRRLIAAMPTATGTAVRAVLDHGGDTAGGIMTTVVPTASIGERVTDIRARLREHALHVVDLDAIAVVDTEGRLVDDIAPGRAAAGRARHPAGRSGRAAVAGRSPSPRTPPSRRWRCGSSTPADCRSSSLTTGTARSGASSPTTSSTPWCPRMAGSASRACTD